MSRRPPSREDELVARLFRPLAGEGAFNLRDDAARLVPPYGHELVLTADAIVLGIHAFFDDPPDLIARKALRMNLSDLAAKGAKPIGFLMTIALPQPFDESWLTRFVSGLAVDSRAFACPLLGGDTTGTSGPFSVSLTLIGAVRLGHMPTRLDARPGDLVAVTGTIGDAALGLVARLDAARAERWNLTPEQRDHLARRYLLPEPRTVVADAIARHARAAMDVSDGLVGDLERLCRASAVAAHIEAERVPLSAAAREAALADAGALQTALTGGDDYEVLLTVHPRSWPDFRAECEANGVAAAVIGEITIGEAGEVVVTHRHQQLVFQRGAFSHL